MKTALMSGVLVLFGAGALAQEQPGGMGGMDEGGMGGMMMMQCRQMMQSVRDADVTVENTETGAVIRMTTDDPGAVAQVQRMAQMMANCCRMSDGDSGDATPPEGDRPQHR